MQTNGCRVQDASLNPATSQPSHPAFQTPLTCSNSRISLGVANIWISDAAGNTICLVSRQDPEHAHRVASELIQGYNAYAATRLAEADRLLSTLNVGLRIEEVPLSCAMAGEHTCTGTVRTYRIIGDRPWAGEEHDYCTAALRNEERAGYQFEAVNL
jgi:hypothetical protein